MSCRRVFLVVLYNKNLESSETLLSLFKHQKLLSEIDLIIWDNSAIKELKLEKVKKHFSELKEIIFHQNGENTALSKIYNYVIVNYLKDYDYFTILDHDSQLPISYFQELLNVTEANNEMLILPKIISNNNLVSPAKLFYFLGSYFRGIYSNKLAAKHVTAINSGMTIKTSCFLDLGFKYDESLHFYGTDDNFMKYYCENNAELYVLNSEIKHTLNYYTDEPLKIKVWRFHEIMNGILYLNKDAFILRVSSVLYVFIKSLKECIQNRSLKFLIFKWKS